jgi:hypothetical protein
VNSVKIIEQWDPRGKRWVPVAFDWYTDDAGEKELRDLRRINSEERFRLMEYIPVTQAKNYLASQSTSGADHGT